jgi:multiple sugar transport system permease protein
MGIETTAASDGLFANLKNAIFSGRMPILLILPSLILALFIITSPLYQLLNYAVHETNRFGFIKGYSGIEHFVTIFSDDLFIAALYRTLIWTVCVVLGTVAISVPVASILNRDFIGRSVARTIIMLPWAVSLPMTAIVWRWGLNSQSGMVNHSLTELGIIKENLVWLSDPVLAFSMEILVGILVSIPFTVTIFLGGLSSVSADLYEAARIDGANLWQQFLRITFPLLRPYINMAIVLNIIYVFNSFPIIWIMTQGGPNNKTEILVTYLYEQAFTFGRIGEASAVSVVMLCFLMVFVILYAKMVMKNESKI